MTAPASRPRVETFRNVGIFAHVDAGKTTLTERILFDTGRQRICGDVDAGTATMDWLREEQERGISIGAGVARVRWRGHTIQIVDTPGHVDFSAEVQGTLPVVDGAILVLDGTRGVEARTRAVWRALSAREIPCLLFVNKLDRAGADYERCLLAAMESFDRPIAPLVLPMHDDNGDFVGLIDARRGLHLRFAAGPAPSPDELQAHRAALLEVVAEVDSELMEAFCEDRPIESGQILRSLRRATNQGAVVPALAGCALRNQGVEPLLDAVASLLPPPDVGAEAEPVRALAFHCEPMSADDVGSGAPKELECEASVAIRSGVLRPGARLRGLRSGKELRVLSVAVPHGPRRDPLELARPGEIVCLRVDSALPAGDTLAEPGAPTELEGIAFPQPILEARLEPKHSDALDALTFAAERLASVDPSLLVRRDEREGALILSGMGELHLEVFSSRLARRVEDGFRLGSPVVRSWSTIDDRAGGTGDCERALGEVVLRACVEVAVEPQPKGELRVRWLVSEELPEQLRLTVAAALEQGARVGLDGSPPLDGVAIEVLTVAGDLDDRSAEALFAEAAELALQRAVASASPVSLEPWVGCTVSVPTGRLQSVLADLRVRGIDGEVSEQTLDRVVLLAEAPLRALLGYPTRLRSLTQGEGEVELRPLGVSRIEGSGPPGGQNSAESA